STETIRPPRGSRSPAAAENRPERGAAEPLGGQDCERHLRPVYEVPAPVETRKVGEGQRHQKPRLRHSLPGAAIGAEEAIERQERDEKAGSQTERQTKRVRRIKI